MTKQDWILGILIAAAGAAFVILLTRSPSTEQTEPIVIGVSPFQDTLLPYVGKEKGWYKEAGLDVRFRVLGWTEILEALSAPTGSGVDVALYNICGIVGGHAQNPELVYAYGVNPFDNGFAIVVRPNSGIATVSELLDTGLNRDSAIKKAIAQLRGKAIVTTSNTDMEQGVWSAVRRAGLNFEFDIEIINLPPEEGLAAFLSGRGDAYIGGVPQRFAAVEAGMVELVTGNDIGPVPINGFVTTRDFLNHREAELLSVIKVWFRIVEHTNNNIDDTAQIIADRINQEIPSSFTPQDFKNAWNVIESFPPTLEAIEDEILNESGRNYWKARWNSCNEYFTDVVQEIERPVSPTKAFLMETVHDSLVEKI